MSRISRHRQIGMAAVALVLLSGGDVRADEPSVAVKSAVAKRAIARLKAQHAPSSVRRMAVRQAHSANADPQRRDWLYDYVARVRDGQIWNDIVGEPLPESRLKWRQRGTAVARGPGPSRVTPGRLVRRLAAMPMAPAPSIVAPGGSQRPIQATLVPSPHVPPAVPGATVAPTPSVPAAVKVHAVPLPPREVTTGALPAPTDRNLQEDDILELAEKTQAALDLVKLELAGRTYDEQKTSGERVFVERPDWKVLENAHDSMTESERSAAVAAGFIAHAYVNDATRTIVVAVAGSQDLRRDFIAADVWQALMRSEAPQHFYFAKSYMKSVIHRYQLNGYVTECVGHSLGGGACAYAATELGIRGYVVNPISAGTLPHGARSLVTNYIVDGDIASVVYPAFGNEISGEIRRISNGRERVRQALKEKYGLLAGPILVVRDAASSVTNHKIGRALERIAVHAGVTRPR